MGCTHPIRQDHIVSTHLFHPPRVAHPAAWAVGALTLATALAACSPNEPAAVADVVRPAYVATVRSASEALQSYVGDVRATRRADLSFGVAGLVSDVAVQVGDSVRQGQLLASLDNKPQQAQLAAASAELQRAQALAAEAHQRVERMRPAQLQDAASSTEWGAVQLELASAQAALKAAQAQREQAAWLLDKTQLRSPIDGVVALRNLERGQAAGPGAPVMAVDGSGRELVIHVPGKLRLKPGQTVRLQGLAGTLQSRVLHSAERLDAGGVRQVWLAVPDDAQVGSTWSVSVNISDTGKASAVLQIPLRAVMPDQGGDTGTALRLAKDGQTLEKLSLKLGQIQGDWLDVKESNSLRPGDRVVVAGALALRAGMKIQPVMAKP